MAANAEAVAFSVVACAAATFIWLAKDRVRRRTAWTPMEGWNRKRPIYKFVSPEKLLVITDFDATLTTGDSDQCHDLVGFSKLLSKAFRDDFAPLLDWSTNTDIDGVEWWDRAHSYMVKHGMPPRQLIPRLVRESKMIPRPGALDMLKRLEDLGIPCLIVSAGLSDVIEEFLRQHGALSENITVCSNRLNYAGDSTPKSVSPTPPITSFTKEYAYSSASSFFAQHSARRNLVIMGDSITDVDPAVNVPHDHCLSIGFLNSRPDGVPHAKAFDAIVMGNEGSLLPLADLLDEIAPQPSLYRSFSQRAMNGM